ncbi:hypothetical protein C5C31_08505 [Rathayibacter rathayi]|nr:hypothetical protein C5C31_08505 [Rathayibacter rathayi]
MSRTLCAAPSSTSRRPEPEQSRPDERRFERPGLSSRTAETTRAPFLQPPESTSALAPARGERRGSGPCAAPRLCENGRAATVGRIAPRHRRARRSGRILFFLIRLFSPFREGAAGQGCPPSPRHSADDTRSDPDDPSIAPRIRHITPAIAAERGGRCRIRHLTERSRQGVSTLITAPAPCGCRSLVVIRDDEREDFCMPAETPRYKYSLRGQDALAWLAEREMCGEEVGDSEIRLVADEIVLPDLRMARLWHTAAAYTIARTSQSALLLLQIEGTCTIDSDEWNEPAELGPGDAAVLPGGTRFGLSSESTTARYELDYELEVLPPAAREELAQGRILVAPAREYRDAVAATSNAALNSGMSLRDAGFSDFAAGVRHLMTALLLQALETSSPWLLTSTSALHRNAMRVIAARAADPGFDIESLAAAVRTSPRNLRHVFAQAGTTAKVALTAERVRLARQQLARRAEGRSLTRAEVARLSGFRDVRALRRAVAKQVDEGLAEEPATRRETGAR